MKVKKRGRERGEALTRKIKERNRKKKLDKQRNMKVGIKKGRERGEAWKK